MTLAESLGLCLRRFSRIMPPYCTRERPRTSPGNNVRLPSVLIDMFITWYLIGIQQAAAAAAAAAAMAAANNMCPPRTPRGRRSSVGGGALSGRRDPSSGPGMRFVLLDLWFRFRPRRATVVASSSVWPRDKIHVHLWYRI